MKVIFVDAYNVINSWNSLGEFKNVDFDVARNKFIDIMENYAVSSGYKVFLIFDGYGSERTGCRRTKISENLDIIFTKRNELADTYIEKIVHKIGKKIEIIVVTSDYLEQQIVFQRGASRISSLEFYNDVCIVNEEVKSKIKKINSVNKDFLLMNNLDDSIISKLEKIRRVY